MIRKTALASPAPHPRSTAKAAQESVAAALPGPNPGVKLPQSHHRPAYATEIEAVVQIDTYEGLVKNENGLHEHAIGHIVLTNAVADPSKIDCNTVDLAMNVANPTDPAGLPHECPLKVGDKIEIEGEYIDAKDNKSHDGRGVIHFTHTPLGYVILPDGTQYK